MPLVATIAAFGAWRKAPTRIRISPTNPFNIGSPMLEKTAIPKNAAWIGIAFAVPPKSEISRVCRRSYRKPTSRNSAPVESPWFTIWSTPPTRPWTLKTKIPSTTRPMWATDEYATSRLTSLCTIATSEP